MIDSKDLKALRTADTVSFHSDGNGSIIKASKKAPKDSLSEFDFNHGIEVDAMIGENERAFAMNMFANLSNEWGTIARSLKVGDTLTLDWRKDHGTNGYCKEATTTLGYDTYHGLHVDVLFLVVKRPTKTRDKTLTFYVDSSVCPENTARMITNNGIKP